MASTKPTQITPEQDPALRLAEPEAAAEIPSDALTQGRNATAVAGSFDGETPKPKKVADKRSGKRARPGHERGRKGKKLALGTAAAFSSFIGVAAEGSINPKEAYADHVCGPTEFPDYTLPGEIIGYDEFGNPQYKIIYMCYDDPAPTTIEVTIPPPQTTAKPPSTTAGGGGSVTTVNNTVAATFPDGDNDGFTGAWEANPNSTGLGQEGLDLLKDEMVARGLDPASLTNDQMIAALSVHPDDWVSNPNLEGIMNTPLSTIAATTTVEDTVSTAETTTVEEATDSTGRPEAALPASSTTFETRDPSGGKNTSSVWWLIGSPVAAAIVGALARRKRRVWPFAAAKRRDDKDGRHSNKPQRPTMPPIGGVAGGD